MVIHNVIYYSILSTENDNKLPFTNNTHYKYTQNIIIIKYILVVEFRKSYFHGFGE
jgi:hypothetical protein